MLQRSFVFLEGVGPQRERRIWEMGIRDWDDFLETPHIRGIGHDRKRRMDEQILRAKEEVALGRVRAVAPFFPKNELWRLYPHLDPKLFLDIETTGLSPAYADVTCVGVRDDEGTRVLVRGRDLSKDTVKRRIERAGVLVTFNGMRFDVPFMETALGMRFPDIPHLDLMYLLRRLGFRGGLKRIERELGLSRDDDIAGVDGLEAVRLWRRWEHRGDREALETLCRYNAADVDNLEELARTAYRLMMQRTLEGV